MAIDIYGYISEPFSEEEEYLSSLFTKPPFDGPWGGSGPVNYKAHFYLPYMSGDYIAGTELSAGIRIDEIDNTSRPINSIPDNLIYFWFTELGGVFTLEQRGSPSTYLIKEEDAGKKIYFSVGFFDDAGNAEVSERYTLGIPVSPGAQNVSTPVGTINQESTSVPVSEVVQPVEDAPVLKSFSITDEIVINPNSNRTYDSGAIGLQIGVQDSDFRDASVNFRNANNETFQIIIRNLDYVFTSNGVDTYDSVTNVEQNFDFALNTYRDLDWDFYLINIFDSTGNVLSLNKDTILTYAEENGWSNDQVTSLRNSLNFSVDVREETSVSSVAISIDDLEKVEADTVRFLVSTQNEVFSASSESSKIMISGRKQDYSLSKTGVSGDWSIEGSNIGTDTLSGFERLTFDDGTLALDTDPGETAGQAYRLYQAAFARTPDMPGVAYHMNDMENNGLSIKQIASNFMASPEFKNMYGENPSDDEYINALYQNVLGRGASSDEVAYYQDHFDRGIWDRPQVMINFAESPENVSLVAPQIEDGIWMPF